MRQAGVRRSGMSMALSRPDPDDILRGLSQARADGNSVLSSGDEQYLTDLVKLIRSGAHAVVIVQTGNDHTKYLFAGLDRLQAIALMARIIQASAEKERGERP